MPVGKTTVVELVQGIQSLHGMLRCVAHLGIEPGEPGLAALGVLGYVHNNPRTRAAAAARWLGVGPAVLSRHVAELESSGMVVRRPDPDDARAQLLELTDAGRAAVERSIRQRGLLLQEMLVDWDESEARDAIETLGKIETILRAGVERGAGRRGAEGKAAV
ncbi:hypothetical protein NCCP1664_28170 [Zafaria cholistanensis]|uniref:HTH marR-type domain-containing protein n=1 Tax=Zafaria cholistanensis TaxID=1682741 RepID=A0A5A7NV67_9MICC|nr:MarR family winged helix-turn-helix transcriptional regulator [Zafaria cholistanensis]GER24322.1 hypothetical protein NCCP1664_28170 [Zafaria cholistanensis]